MGRGARPGGFYNRGVGSPIRHNFYVPNIGRMQPDPLMPPRPDNPSGIAERRGVARTPPQWTLKNPFVGRLIDRRTLARAEQLANRWNVPVHNVLLSTGWIRPDDYGRTLAAETGIDFVEDVGAISGDPANLDDTKFALKPGILMIRQNGVMRIALTPEALRPGELRALRRRSEAKKHRFVMTTPDIWLKAVIKIAGARLTHNAVYGLLRRHPDMSASSGLTLSQILILSAFICFAAALSVIAPGTAIAGLTAILTLFFLLISSFRIAACLHLLSVPRNPRERLPHVRLKDSKLPVYTVLVPLFRETEVLPDLIRALSRLDYPIAKLDIKLIIESTDRKMQRALERFDLPANMDVIIAPESHPRTKPKALNFALHFARGEFVVIYDAKDQPEPDQIRKALVAFENGPKTLACVQARLNFYNAGENWLTKQFAIEYSALFDGLLPTLQELKLPIPLGGTSNHFRMNVLRDAGSWDAFNVTEDADLGMRIYRRGYCCQMLDSTTYEEANCRTVNWVKQRTRWMKGWIQTYFVHMRHPVRLRRELGLRGFITFQAIVGGVVISALAHPLFLIALLTGGAGALFSMPDTILGLHLSVTSLFNLSVGYAAAIALGYLAARKRRFKGLGLQIWFMPIYWLIVSFAAYRAVGQSIFAHFHWEKTQHGLSKMRPQITPHVRIRP